MARAGTRNGGMPLHPCAAFVVAGAALSPIPGPNVALIVANSLAHGPRYSLLTVVGTTSAMVPRPALTIMGMATLLVGVADWFQALRWIGVAYPLYPGIGATRAPAQDPTATDPQGPSVRAAFPRDFSSP